MTRPGDELERWGPGKVPIIVSEHIRDPHLTIRGAHHGILGVLPAVAGLWIILEAPLRSLPHLIAGGLLAALGVWLIVDDVYQHICQHYRPGYRSPVNQLYGKIGRRLGLFSTLLLIFLSCSSSRPPLDGGRLDAPVTGRPAPTVSWGHAEPGEVRFILAAGEPMDTTIQIYRFEWAPAGDTCFSPISYATIWRSRGAGVLFFSIGGLEAGDQIMVWRSHPWPGYENTPDPDYCLIPVRIYQGGVR